MILGRKHHVGFKELGDGVEPADSFQPRRSQDNGVEVAGFAWHYLVGDVAGKTGYTAKAGVNVAADVQNLQVRAGSAELCSAPG
jgi:hypothetical protein